MDHGYYAAERASHFDADEDEKDSLAYGGIGLEYKGVVFAYLSIYRSVLSLISPYSSHFRSGRRFISACRRALKRVNARSRGREIDREDTWHC